MRNCFYLGRFPGPVGGVTVKNEAVYNLLNETIDVKKIDLSRIKNGDLFTAFKLLYALFSRKSRLVIGTAGSARRAVSHLLYVVNRKALRSSCLLVMGGQFADKVAKDSQYQRWVREYRRIFVETNSMVRKLNDVGITNVDLFPNCRNRPKVEFKPKPREGRLKCVFFSMIYPEKGVDLILEAAKQIPEVDFDFWGDINKEYRQEFIRAVDSLDNCRYCGAFCAKNQDETYTKLHEYDVMLLPTRCFGEGIPGALVEAKIAATPAIVSNYPNVDSVIKNDGLRLGEYSTIELVNAIKKFDSDDDLLSTLKEAAIKTRAGFYFDSYKDLLLQYLK